MRMLRSTLAGLVALMLLAGLGTAVTAQEEQLDTTLFPTGTFVAEEDGLTMEFRTDWTCERSGTPCTYGVRGNLYSEMTFEDASGEQVPATYYWDFGGERLTFEPWGEDRRPSREDAYAGHTYRLVGDTVPLPAMETDFPSKAFVRADGADAPLLSFRENGTYTGYGWVGKYIVNGNHYTEMTHNSNTAAKVPATYKWHWDGERLSFSTWGEDPNPWRRDMLSHAFVPQPSVLGDMRRLFLSDPRLDVWVTVEIAQSEDGGYFVRATVDDEPLGEGIGDTPQEAARAALEALGEPYASEMAEHVKG